MFVNVALNFALVSLLNQVSVVLGDVLETFLRPSPAPEETKAGIVSFSVGGCFHLFCTFGHWRCCKPRKNKLTLLTFFF